MYACLRPIAEAQTSLCGLLLMCLPCCVLCRAVLCAVQMGLVSQECLLFQGTIEDNIRYGTAHATSQAVVEAAKAAYAHEFILAMPHVSVQDTAEGVTCHMCHTALASPRAAASQHGGF